ncbi:metal-dependent hydrolase [Nocardia salmonicida]|uniref:metal-dependent hydrolase n=1 Tax=Nocardia salmonicida TaxID=53431 RepID=UPI0036B6F8BF
MAGGPGAMRPCVLHPGEAPAPCFVDVMYPVLPGGKRAMANCLAEALPLIDDERLREEIVGVIGQEPGHASSRERAHKRRQSAGLDVAARCRLGIAWLADLVVGNGGLAGRAKHEWLKERLGLFASMGHYTAVIEEWLLHVDILEQKGIHPTVLDLVRWHDAHEVEQRSVVYDVYMYVDGSYARKARTAVLAGTALLPLFAVSTICIFRVDPSRDKGRFWPLQFVNATVHGLIPSFTVLFTESARYLRRGFHPPQLTSTDTAPRFQAHSSASWVTRR